MGDIQIQPVATDNNQSGRQNVANLEEQLILKSLTLPHGISVDAAKASTVEGYDTIKVAGSTPARPDWSSDYSQSMRTLMEATKNQPPEVLHAADYVLEQVAKLSEYNEQKIIQARLQIAQDLNDGSFAEKVSSARHKVEMAVEPESWMR